VCCSVLQCVAVCCSVLQCVVVCCSVLQCVLISILIFNESGIQASSRIIYTFLEYLGCRVSRIQTDPVGEMQVTRHTNLVTTHTIVVTTHTIVVARHTRHTNLVTTHIILPLQSNG